MTTTADRRPRGRRAGRAAISAKTLRTDRWWFKPAYTVVGLSAWLIWGLVHTLVMQDWYFAQGAGLPLPDAVLLALRVDGVRPGGGRVRPVRCRTGRWSRTRRSACRSCCCSGSPATTTGRRTTARSGSRRRPARCRTVTRRYTGETRFPLVFQNLHRYAFYAAVLISLLNTWDAILSFHGTEGFGFGLGNVILVGNVVLLWAYTVSCHSCRHIMGGRLKHFSAHPVRYRAWTFVSKLNTRHKELAWITLGSLALTDFYVMAHRRRLVLRPPLHQLRAADR